MSGLRPMLANVAVVTVVSLLLWLWAAGQTRETSTVEVMVLISPSDAERSIVTPAEAIAVSLEIRGARHELERAVDRLSGKTILLRTGRPEVPASPGQHTIDLAGALNRSEEVISLGVAAIGSVPTATTIDVMETATVEAKIVPVIPGVQLAGPAEATPGTTRVTLPKSLVSGLGADPTIEAFVTAAQANAREAGRRDVIEVNLRVPEALEEQARLVRMVPDRAKVSFTLQSRSSSTVLRLVPVQIAGPPLDLDGYQVSIDPGNEFLRDVEVTGPAATIRQLEEGTAKVFAFVHVSADDLARRITRKRVEMWMLPPGVSVVRIGESPETSPDVRFSVRQRTQRPAGGS